MEEGRKRVLLIAAAILAARKLPSPARRSSIPTIDSPVPGFEIPS